MIDSYPLQWAVGYPRTTERKSSAFKAPVLNTLKDLQRKTKRLTGNDSLVISSNVPVRRDGLMYSDVANDKLKDPGVAVYFTYEDRQVVLCCDKWETPAENVRAICLTMQAMLSLDRWGVSDMLNRAFTGFRALPQKGGGKSWWEVLNVSPNANEAQIKQAYKKAAFTAHPDHGGGVEQFQEVNNAYIEGIARFKK